MSYFLEEGYDKLYLVSLFVKNDPNHSYFFKVGHTHKSDVTDRFREDLKHSFYSLHKIYASAKGLRRMVLTVEEAFKRMYPKDINLDVKFKGITEIISTMPYEDVLEKVSKPIRELNVIWQTDALYIPSFVTREDAEKAEWEMNKCPMD